MHPMLRLSCAVATAATLAVAPAGPAGGAVLLGKAEARRVAVTVAGEACRVVTWCRRSEVVPARRCVRERRNAVHCGIAFVTAGGRRCGGVVVVSKTAAGRLDRALAVPMDCSSEDEEATLARTPSPR